MFINEVSCFLYNVFERSANLPAGRVISLCRTLMILKTKSQFPKLIVPDVNFLQSALFLDISDNAPPAITICSYRGHTF